MRFKFDEFRAIQAASILLSKTGRTMKYKRLIKLLYLADRLCLVRHGYTITGDAPFSMNQGPILSEILNLVTQKRQDLPNREWHKYIPRPAKGVFTVQLTKEPSFQKLSRAERAILEEVFGEHGNKKEYELYNFVHGLPEYTDPGTSSFPIPFEEILAKENFKKPEIQAIARNASAVLELQTLVG